MHFEATEENKLIYTDIFKKYQDTIETYISKVGIYRLRFMFLLPYLGL